MISSDSVGIAFLVAVLHDLEVLLADVQDAYLNAPPKEKVCTTAGLEFGKENSGRPVLSIRALFLYLDLLSHRDSNYSADAHTLGTFKFSLKVMNMYFRTMYMTYIAHIVQKAHMPKHINCYMIFDAKLVGLVRKTGIVAVVHQIDTLK